MGMAPYGDPSIYREELRLWYTLLPSGDYSLRDDYPGFIKFWTEKVGEVEHEKLSQASRNFAASLQESIEIIVFHVLKHFQKQLKSTHLVMAGGVAHNCSLNGKILRSGLFQKVWVHPAAHDAGAGVGSGLLHFFKSEGSLPLPLKDLFLGPSVGTPKHIEAVLGEWSSLIEFSTSETEECLKKTAKLLASGKVIGWINGRSEFGPRALGGRSILADPRPASNKGRINSMVKKREGYRPFAPSVLVEEFREWFDVPNSSEALPYMIFVVNVRSEKQDTLGAVTHIDGTSRVQTIDAQDSPNYWKLISFFKEETGVPILLNTSFNNNAEPVVDSLEDALTCFLTTGLDLLVIEGKYIVSKKHIKLQLLNDFDIRMNPRCTLQFGAPTRGRNKDPYCGWRVTLDKFPGPGIQVFKVNSGIAHVLFSKEPRPAEILFEECKDANGISETEFLKLVLDLWSKRVLILRPLKKKNK
jgi:carbamoyltransferase